VISRDRLWAAAAELARHHKHAGAPSELESLRYLERELAAAGYATELILHDAYISLPGAAVVEAGGERIRAITHSFSRPTDGLEGTIGVDVLRFDGLATPAAALAARAAGAKAHVHVSPYEHLHEMCISPVWGSPDDVTRAELPTAVAVSVPRSAAPLLPDGARVRIVAEVDTGWRATPILVAELADPGEPFVLLSGHHDAWYAGAMDNGGANATMLEVARACAARRDRWRRGLRVAFWSGHSQGRYSSSAWYADHHWEELELRAVAHVNVDSTGGRGNTDVTRTTSSAELRALAAEALAVCAGQDGGRRRMQRAGDQSFWGIGVPSVFGNMGQQPPDPGRVGVGFDTGWWWHTPDDTLDKLDLDVLERDTRIYEHVVRRLLEAEVPPLDFAATGRELHAVLEERAAAGVDVARCLERARALVERAERFAAAPVADASAAWECLRRVSRAVVPVDYTLGDRFAHDPALAQPALPSLAGDPHDPFAAVRLVRAANRVAVALRDAVAAYDEYLRDA